MSSVRRVRNTAPVKKSNTGLVVGIIVAIVLIGLITAAVLLYFLWWKKRGTSSTTPTKTTTTTVSGKCTSGADCPSGKVCNLSDNTCVQCTVDSQCSGTTPVCHNNACVAGCLTDADCSGANPRCLVAAKTCVACVADGDCPSGQHCNGSTNTCIGCTQDSDCSAGSTCTSGVCCDQRPPQAFSIASNTMENDPTVTASYFLVQDPGVATVRMNLYNSDGTLIARSNYIAATGTDIFHQSDFPANTYLFAGVSYKASINLSGTCGSTVWTTPESLLISFTMAACTTNPNLGVQVSGTNATREIAVTLASVPGQTAGVAVSDTPGFLPNQGLYNFYNLAGVSAYSGFTYTVTIPAGPTVMYIWTWLDPVSGTDCTSPPLYATVSMA